MGLKVCKLSVVQVLLESRQNQVGFCYDFTINSVFVMVKYTTSGKQIVQKVYVLACEASLV